MDGRFVAIKMHFGELGNLAFLRPNYAKVVADLCKEQGGMPFLTCLLYTSRVCHRQQHIGKLLGLLPGKIQCDGLGLPHSCLLYTSCSGDLADLKVKSCDIEAWSPRQQKYFEVCSCSNLGDAQARRLHIRIKGKDGKTYLAHTLNNTCVAPPRMLIAFLENHLQADGSVTIPEVLQPYMGGLKVMVPTNKKD